MPRIRSIKPSFFTSEELQDLELAHPGQYPMLVFAGLWGHCDKLGRFRWKPRTLKLSILPFLSFDMEHTLLLLEEAGYLRRYEVEGERYGFIPTFTKHQRVNGKEAQEAAEYPDPIDFIAPTQGKQWGSSGEAVGKQLRRQEGKGREEEEKEKPPLPPLGGLAVDEVVAAWNSIPTLARAESVTGPIRKSITRRTREHPGLDWFTDIFHRVSRSDFLTGKKSDFVATIDWVLGPKNLAKILNGNYDNRGSPHRAPPVRSVVELLTRREVLS